MIPYARPRSSRLGILLATALAALLGPIAPVPAVPPATTAPDPVIVGAGDIADCRDRTGAEATAAVLDRVAGTVFTLGDNAYVDGTPQEYARCYDPTWGRHRARTRLAAAGNHDYNTPGAAGFFDYFGAAAGDPARGYYDTTVGSWHVIVLNSNCEAVGGCGAGSPQEQWLRRALRASDAHCTVALWHNPAFSSATVHRAFPTYQPFWQALYDHGADVVLVASDHVYERFAPQTPTGDADPAFGLRQFTVGTGGRSHQAFKAVLPNSQVRNGGTYGVLALTLRARGYDWRFVPEAGKTFSDAGTGTCHGARPPPAQTPGPITPTGSSSNSSTAGSSLTLARPAETEAGRVMVASIVSSEDDPAVSAPPGWTRVRSDSIPGRLRQTIYLRVAGPSEPPSYTWTLSRRRRVAGGITTYSGVDTRQPVDAHAAVVSRRAGTGVSPPSIRTTTPDAMVVHLAAVNAEGTIIPPAGMTSRWLAAAPTGAVTDALAAGFDAPQPRRGPTGRRTARATEPGGRIAAILALRPAR